MRPTRSRLLPLLLPALVLAGCQAGAPAPGATGALRRGVYYESDQGTRLVGATPMLGGATFAGAPLDVMLVHGELVARAGGTSDPYTSLADHLPATFQLLGGPGGSLTVQSVSPHLNPYGLGDAPDELEYEAVLDATNKGLCSDDAAENRALATPGLWTSAGDVLLANAFTFACIDHVSPDLKSSVIVKCIDWGYKPWIPFAGPTLAGGVLGAPPADAFPGERFHHACTRMARADYCGNGQPFTVDGTRIQLYDVLDTLDHVETDMSFEAAWRPGGYQGGYVGGGPVCLTKLRWEKFRKVIPPGCPLPDPEKTMQAHYCDDEPVYHLAGKLSSKEVEAVGALLFNYSYIE